MPDLLGKRPASRCKRPATHGRRRLDECTFYTQNCLGAKTETRVTEIVSTCRSRHTFAAFLQETWRKGKELKQCDDGFRKRVGVGPDAAQRRCRH